jgi:hypothetical protein
MNTTIDIRTQNEKERDEKHKQICSDFLNLSNQISDCKPNRILVALAKRYNMSVPGVKNVVVSNGLYKVGNK